MLAGAVNETAAEKQSEDYYVSDITVTGRKAAVTYSVGKDCTLIVGIYDDEGTKLYATATAVLDADADSCTVSFNKVMPETFLVKAFVVDTATICPMGKAYTNNHYTAEFIEFKNKTTADFPKDQVVLLGNETKTNFAVLKDSVHKIDAQDGDITIKEDGTYVIENASSELQELKKDDSFCIWQEEQQIAVKVGDIRVNGTTVTVVPEESGLEDMFDYIKIEQTNDKVSVVEPDGTEAPEGNGTAKIQAAEAGYEETNTLTYSFKSDKKSEDDKAKAMLEASVNISFKTDVKIYYDGKNDLEVDMSVTPSVSGKVNAAASYAETFSMKPLNVALGHGLYVTFTPSLVVDASAKLDYDYNLSAVAGFSYSTITGLANKCVSPKFENALKIEGDLYVGVKLKPGLYFISEKLIRAGMEAETGLHFHAQAAADNTTVNDEVRHDCLLCFKGETYRKFLLKADVEVLGGMEIWGREAKKEWTLMGADNPETKIGDFYYSVDTQEGGKGFCPYQQYRTVLKVTDLKDNPLSGITVYSGNGKESVGTTDEKGELKLYLADGSWLFAVKGEDGDYITCNVIVDDAATSAFMQMDKKQEVTVTVRDKNGKALSGVNVEQDGENVGMTDADGQLILDLSADTYSFCVYSADGPVKKQVTVRNKNVEVAFEIEPEDMSWKEVYRDFLMEYRKDASHSRYKFELVYIDEDNVPELLIYDGTRYNLYMIWNQEVRELGSYYCYLGFCYAERQNMIMTGNMRYGYDSMALHSIVNGESECLHKFYNNAESLDELKEYTYNDKKLSREEYWAKVEEVKKGKEFRFLYGEGFHPLTEENINAVLYGTSSVKQADLIQEDCSKTYVAESTASEQKTFTEKNLKAGTEYLLIIVKDAKASNLLSSGNILYIDQRTSSEDGGITFEYQNITETNTCLLYEQYEESAFTYGDINADGTITLKDAQAVLKAALKLATLDDTQKLAADVNKDGNVGLADAQLILKFALKLIGTF